MISETSTLSAIARFLGVWNCSQSRSLTNCLMVLLRLSTTFFLSSRQHPNSSALFVELSYPSPKSSGQILARHAVAVSVEVVRIARVLLEHPLCLFVGREARAVQVDVSAATHAG